MPTNFKAPVDYLDEQKAISKMTVMPGYQVTLFASEKEFPELRKPVQMSLRQPQAPLGRRHPAIHYKPGGRVQRQRQILIFEDTDGDGKADKQTVFAEGLHLPIGSNSLPRGVSPRNRTSACWWMTIPRRPCRPNGDPDARVRHA